VHLSIRTTIKEFARTRTNDGRLTSHTTAQTLCHSLSSVIKTMAAVHFQRLSLIGKEFKSGRPISESLSQLSFCRQRTASERRCVEKVTITRNRYSLFFFRGTGIGIGFGVARRVRMRLPRRKLLPLASGACRLASRRNHASLGLNPIRARPLPAFVGFAPSVSTDIMPPCEDSGCLSDSASNFIIENRPGAGIISPPRRS